MILTQMNLLLLQRDKRFFGQVLFYDESIIMKKIDKELTFEENLKKLEDIVEQLESGNINLEKSVELYEKGMLLTCYLLWS